MMGEMGSLLLRYFKWNAGAEFVEHNLDREILILCNTNSLKAGVSKCQLTHVTAY